MRTLWILILTVSLLSGTQGCDSGPRRFAKNKKNILPKDTMRAVLKDIHIAEAALKADHIPEDSVQYYARGFYRAVLDKHQVTVKTYKRSLNYYVENPDVMNSIYEPLIQSLEKQKQAMDSTS